MSQRMVVEAPQKMQNPAPTFKDVLQRKCDKCEDEKEKGAIHLLQRSAVQGGPETVPPIVNEVLQSPGQPLDAETRAFMEPRFGHDFSQVRVHTDAKATESARALHALAYTVGKDVIFGHGRYQPGNRMGQQLIAHELTHVIQQENIGNKGVQGVTIEDEYHPTEREASLIAQAIISSGRHFHVNVRAGRQILQRHKDDFVTYSGGQGGTLSVVQAGSLVYSGPAVSGHPIYGENEPGYGPIPTGTYALHPGIIRPTVTRLQKGTCGANGISSGYQEITSTDRSPCLRAHYCNVPCPIRSNPDRMCFTPLDCWGPYRIKIEGSVVVTTPAGRRERRDGFYIHGGNSSDAVSSGCVKSLNNSVFKKIRLLTGIKGKVLFCVGSTCPPLPTIPKTEAFPLLPNAPSPDILAPDSSRGVSMEPSDAGISDIRDAIEPLPGGVSY